MKLVLTLLALGLLVTGAEAQEDTRLVAAVRLAQDGQGDSARRIVLDLLSRTPAGDTLYPQLVYTMGLVARDAGDRSRNFRRVAVEFGSSAWADDALLGLAQEDFAAGRAEEAARGLERIRSDYPASPLLPTVALWAARSYFELRRTPDACRWLTQGLALSAEDIELRNQLLFYQPRCAEAVAAAQDSTVRTTQPAPEPGGPVYSVQVAAVGSENAAQGTVDALKRVGYEPHLVQENGLVKVRVGRFKDRGQAAAAASQIRTRLGGSPFVVEEK